MLDRTCQPLPVTAQSRGSCSGVPPGRLGRLIKSKKAAAQGLTGDQGLSQGGKGTCSPRGGKSNQDNFCQRNDDQWRFKGRAKSR